MGWLEVLAMLKRLLPLLSRVAPMLETYVAGRPSDRDSAAAFERIATDLKQDLVTTTAAHRTATEAALAQQTSHLRDLAEEVRQLRVADEERSARLTDVQQRLSAMQSTLRLLLIGIIVILIAIAIGLVVRR